MARKIIKRKEILKKEIKARPTQRSSEAAILKADIITRFQSRKKARILRQTRTPAELNI